VCVCGVCVRGVCVCVVCVCVRGVWCGVCVCVCVFGYCVVHKVQKLSDHKCN